MYDKQTRTLWVHTTGEAIKGKLKGKQLDFIPSVVTTWGKWKSDHPGTTVLQGRRARGSMGTYALTRKPRGYGLSLGQGKKTKLYPFTTLAKVRVINDTFDGKNVVVVFDAPSSTGAAYERGDRTFTWKKGAMMDGSGAKWDLLKGTSEKTALTPLPATAWLTGRWRGFYPRGEVYRK